MCVQCVCVCGGGSVYSVCVWGDSVCTVCVCVCVGGGVVCTVCV